MAEGDNEAEMLTPGWEGGTRMKGQEQDIPCKDMYDHFLRWVPPSSFYHFPVVHSSIKNLIN